MIQLHPDATFDCLFVASRIQTQRQGLATQEIHLFAYLACLLWLYRERPVADWGYRFMGTELGAPYSREIDITLTELIERGYLRKVHYRVCSTENAEQALSDLTELTINRERADCLQAACSSIAAFTAGMVSSALANEPELSRSRALPSSRLLLEDAARSQLYQHFNELRGALAHRSPDLRLPAVVWISALYQTGEGLAVEE